MLVWRIWSSLDIPAFWKLLKVSFSNLTFILPTIQATNKCLKITEKEFGSKHHKNNYSNAFRHALWNYLIIIKAIGWGNSEKKSLIWAKKITNFHETLFKNNPLEKAMDDHNNAVGRYFFLRTKELTEEQKIKALKKLAYSSARISLISELKSITLEQLVHLEVI